jgi:hypothetical protein
MSNATPPPEYPVRVYGAVTIDELDFRPILAAAQDLLAAGHRFLFLSVGLAGCSLWARMRKELDAFKEVLKQAGLWQYGPMLASDPDGDKAIAAQALCDLAVALQKPVKLVRKGEVKVIGDSLSIPYEEVHGVDIDVWFKQLADTIELVKEAIPEQAADTSFIPSPLQLRILEALNHKVLTLDALAEKLEVERSRLHRDALKELKDRGYVKNSRKIGGYYRPDRPPPEYADWLKTQSPE